MAAFDLRSDGNRFADYKWSTIGKILLAWALLRRAIGKMLLTGAAAELLTSCGAVAKLLAGAQWRRGWRGHRSGKDATGRGAMAE